MGYKTELSTTIGVIEALGGNKVVAEMLGTNAAAVSNWRYFEEFPTNTYLALQEALRRQGRTASDSLWPMRTLRTVKQSNG